MLDISIVKLKFLFSNCDVHLRNFIAFQAYLQPLKKSLSGGKRYLAFVQPASALQFIHAHPWIIEKPN